MRTTLITLSIAIIITLGSNAARADQCAVISPQQANAAAARLWAGKQYLEYCEPCGDKRPSARRAVSTIKRTLFSGGPSVHLQVNGEEIDLAYTYVDAGNGRFENLASLVGCPTSDVSPRLQLGSSAVNSVQTTRPAQVCSRVLATRATSFYNRLMSSGRYLRPGAPEFRASCNASSAIAEDNRGAGLDYAQGAELDYVAGQAVSGCIRLDFPLNRGWELAELEVTAMPSSNACSAARTPCQSPHCGLGESFLVFAAHGSVRSIPDTAWKLVKTVKVATPNWSEYKVTLDDPAPIVMICRGGSGPARDDILIDAVKGCAVQGN